ncbi:E3 ubiquitin-protein ligase RBBP6-like [Lithobates pipiens]
MATAPQTKDKMAACSAVKLAANEKQEEELVSQSQSVQEDPPHPSTSKISRSNLAESTASEEEKIRAVMDQSASFYGSDKCLGSPLPPSYICHRCLQSGHLIKDCPIKKKSQTMKKATGIPRTFLKEIDDPNMTGAMLLKTGKYVIPIISAEAYAIKRKEKPQFPPVEPSSSPEEREQIADKVVCLLCKDIMIDAASVPCCANSFCDDCIRTTLLESEEHECPVCHQKGVSPNSIIANKLLRQFIENFNNKGQQRSTMDSPIANYSEASLVKPSTVPPRPELERASCLQMPVNVGE